MTPSELWEHYKTLLFDDPALGVRLDLSRMLSARALEEGESALQAAYSAMDSLEAGGIANPDENRMVGHYWLRAPDRAPSAEITRDIRETQARILDFATRVHDGRVAPPGAQWVRRLLVIGIGGSALGPQLVADALGGPAYRLAQGAAAADEVETVFHILERLAANPDREVVCRPGSTPFDAVYSRPAS